MAPSVYTHIIIHYVINNEIHKAKDIPEMQCLVSVLIPQMIFNCVICIHNKQYMLQSYILLFWY